ncbi:MAG: hypothetical protein AVDCRST_MAG67-2253 [uncultured Solirubrobacteraceae bacterium]|uniref:Uncharacterized protein n=1 Tax=uncultured Solirubrobacteraceae bacterium TaxID=1162706 RepID=A0A6J4STC7_9ACTN|nr:MAG: hypothetical protein AVDCRST_MAG67-2253 [uncultured Solirubrobacteraceae bacterium]
MTAVQTAGPSHTAAPNVFELTCEDTKITYVPVGFGGRPRLEYDGPMGTHVFEGDEIQTLRSARGLEVSVTLDRISILRTITLTVFLPDLAFEDATTELTFETVGIHATRRRATVSDIGEGSTKPLELTGLARNIEFQNAGSTVLL